MFAVELLDKTIKKVTINRSAIGVFDWMLSPRFPIHDPAGIYVEPYLFRYGYRWWANRLFIRRTRALLPRGQMYAIRSSYENREHLTHIVGSTVVYFAECFHVPHADETIEYGCWVIVQGDSFTRVGVQDFETYFRRI